MQVSIHDIQVKNRLRKDLGDLTLLMQSMRKYGQLNPVIVTRQKQLIAGHRRLEAARRLGWATVETVQVDKISEADKIELEIDENLHRKELAPEEIAEGYARIEKLRHPSLAARIWAYLKGLWARIFHRGEPKKQ